jgi:hypothetical protein
MTKTIGGVLDLRVLPTNSLTSQSGFWVLPNSLFVESLLLCLKKKKRKKKKKMMMKGRLMKGRLQFS